MLGKRGTKTREPPSRLVIKNFDLVVIGAFFQNVECRLSLTESQFRVSNSYEALTKIHRIYERTTLHSSQGNYRIQAVKAQCEIRSLEKQLHLAHMRADLEAEESLRPPTQK